MAAKRGQPESPESPPVRLRANRIASSISTPPRLPAVDNVVNINLADSDLTPADIKLHVAVLHARKDRREAPWYGPWNLVLQNRLDFVRGTVDGGFSVISFTQYPLIRYFDTSENDHTEDPHSSDEDENDISDVLPVFKLPESPTVPRKTQRTAGLERHRPNEIYASRVTDTSSPVVQPWGVDNERSPPVTPKRIYPKSLTDPGFLSMLSADKEITVPSAGERGTRIPDFVQKLLRWGSGMKLVSARVLLLVECKPELDVSRSLTYHTAITQIKEQALYAFGSDETVEAVGCILTFGGSWIYMEFYREYFTLDDTKDPTYVPTPSTGGSESSTSSSSEGPGWRTPTKFETPLRQEILTAFTKRYDVLDPKSGRLFDMVHKRLEEIASISKY